MVGVRGRKRPSPQTASKQRRLATLGLVLAAGVPSCATGTAPEPVRAIPGTPLTRSRPAHGPRPNILIFLTDDQRSDSLEVMPETQRWFGQQGTTYTNAFVTTPLCCPARASIFTGRYAHNHGVVDNASAMELDQRSTLHRYLHDAGYRTGISGKFLNEWDLGVDPPSFDRWAIFRDHLNYYGVDFNVDGALETVHQYSTHFVGAQALRFLADFERTDGRPWLLYVAPLASHKPFTPEPKYEHVPVPLQPLSPAVLEDDLSDKPPFLQDPELGSTGARLTRRQQLRTLISADDMVGRVMDQLRRFGELNRTLAFYMSDNGFLAGEHGLVDKRLPYEQSAAIPFFIRWDSRVAAGAEDDRLVANVDVTPTALAAAGVSPSPRYPIDGRDLLAPSPRAGLFMEYFLDPVRPVPEWAALRTTEYLYTEYYAADGSRLFREYYDLVEDPWELTNLLNDGPESNDPSRSLLEQLSREVARGRRCIGTVGRHACS
jgi:arylsulfatase A-like enzyme